MLDDGSNDESGLLCVKLLNEDFTHDADIVVIKMTDGFNMTV